MTTVAARRAAVVEAQDLHAGLSQRRACAVLNVPLSSRRYRSRRAPQEALRQRLRELAVERVTWGYRGLHVVPRREDFQVNH